MHDKFGEEGGWRSGGRRRERGHGGAAARGAGKGGNYRTSVGVRCARGLAWPAEGARAWLRRCTERVYTMAGGKADDGGAAAAAGIRTANSSPSLDGWPRFDGNVPWGTKMGRHVQSATRQHIGNGGMASIQNNSRGRQAQEEQARRHARLSYFLNMMAG